MNIFEAILNIFTAIVNWFSTSVPSLQSIFWNAETGFTFVGTLSAMGVGFGLGLLLLHFIISIIKFRR